MIRIRTCLIAVALTSFMASAAAQMSQSSPQVATDAPASSCPIPEGQRMNFSILTNACSLDLDFCSDCVCGLLKSFWSAHTSSGASWDPNDPSSLAPLLSKLVGINRACTRQYRSEVASAMGPNYNRIRQISDCPWMTSPTVPLPECYQQQLYSLATANISQSNSSGNSLQVVLEQTGGSNNSATNGTGAPPAAATPGTSSVSPDPQSLTASTQTSPVAPPGSASSSSSSDVISYSTSVWMIVSAGSMLLIMLRDMRKMSDGNDIQQGDPVFTNEWLPSGFKWVRIERINRAMKESSVQVHGQPLSR